jgi:radical SAM protein with 4Fe4S-binding SPASM domain
MLNSYYYRNRLSNYSSRQVITILDCNGAIYEGNYTFYEVWSRLDGKKTLNEIIGDIQNEYCIEDKSEIREDVLQIINTMKKMSIITQKRNTAPQINNIDNKIISVHFAITSYCNLNCSHCYLDNKQRHFVSYMDFERTLKDLADNGVLSIEISGGEPLIHKNFSQFISLAKDMGFFVKLFTNATLIGENNIEEMRTNVDSFRISLDGTEKTHDLRRGIGTFHKTMNALHLLKGRDVQVSMTVDDVNYKDIEDVNKISESVGARFEASPVVPYSHISFTQDKLRFIQSKINKVLLSDKCSGKRADIRGINCEAGIRLLYVDSNLDVTPCPLLNSPKWHIGSLKDKTIGELLCCKDYNRVMYLLEQLKSGCISCNMCQFWCAAIVDQTSEKISPLCIR